jgi:hypothetical protein
MLVEITLNTAAADITVFLLASPLAGQVLTVSNLPIVFIH